MDRSESIIRAPQGATVLGGGNVPTQELFRALALAPTLVAADGGAVAAARMGKTPEAVIGDMDSLPDTLKATIDPQRLHLVSEQDSTDFAKCIRSIEAPIIVGIGVFSPRMDHGLASLNLLASNPSKRIALLTESDFCFLCPPYIFPEPAGRNPAVSLPDGSGLGRIKRAEVEDRRHTILARRPGRHLEPNFEASDQRQLSATGNADDSAGGAVRAGR